MTIRKWKFAVVTDDGSGYLLPSGELVRDPNQAEDWIGSNHEAEAEAERRANAAEDRPGPFITRIVYESQGKVKPETKTGEQLELI